MLVGTDQGGCSPNHPSPIFPHTIFSIIPTPHPSYASYSQYIFSTYIFSPCIHLPHTTSQSNYIPDHIIYYFPCSLLSKLYQSPSSSQHYSPPTFSICLSTHFILFIKHSQFLITSTLSTPSLLHFLTSTLSILNMLICFLMLPPSIFPHIAFTHLTIHILKLITFHLLNAYCYYPFKYWSGEHPPLVSYRKIVKQISKLQYYINIYLINSFGIIYNSF